MIGPEIVPGEWSHYAWTHGPQGDTIHFNGVPVVQGDLPDPNPDQITVATIGIEPCLFPEFFNGKIDRLRLWDESRDTTEIQATINMDICPDDVSAFPTLISSFPFQNNYFDATGTNEGFPNGDPEFVCADDIPILTFGEPEVYVLSLPNITASAGTTVTVPVMFCNSGEDVDGWSFGVEVLTPLDVIDPRPGATTSAFNGGAGPVFEGTQLYPGEGWTTGLVISFDQTEVLPPGADYELHLFDVAIPGTAVAGELYPLSFVNTLGDPDVPIGVIVDGQTLMPILEQGSITIAANNYCEVNTNSTGDPALVGFDGSTSISSNDLVLSAAPVPNQPGLFFYGSNQAQTPFGDGFRCVGGSIYRLNPVTGGSGNELSRTVDYGDLPFGGDITPGSTWHFQGWFRDPLGAGSGFNLTDGMSLYFVP